MSSSHWSAACADVMPSRAAVWMTTGPGDEALVAGRYHRGQLVVEARVHAPATGQAEVNRCQLGDLQAAEVVFDAFAQLVRSARREDGAAVVWPDRDLADDRQPVGVGGE